MRRVVFYPEKQFAITRIMLGIYLAIHSGVLIPYAADIFSRKGMLPDPRVNWVYRIWPNPLYHFDQPWVITTIFVVLTCGGFLIAAGICRRPVSLFLWFLWACLLGRNNFTLNPSVPVVGWFLLLFALTPSGEPWCVGRKKPPENEWWMPATLYWGTWLITALSYSMSGILKLPSPSWQDGNALFYAVEQLYGRNWFVTDLFLALPDFILKYMTWGALAMEILFAPLCMAHLLRPIAWAAMFGMHIALIFLMIFFDLSIVLVLLHIYLFDIRWLSRSYWKCS